MLRYVQTGHSGKFLMGDLHQDSLVGLYGDAEVEDFLEVPGDDPLRPRSLRLEDYPEEAGIGFVDEDDERYFDAEDQEAHLIEFLDDYEGAGQKASDPDLDTEYADLEGETPEEYAARKEIEVASEEKTTDEDDSLDTDWDEGESWARCYDAETDDFDSEVVAELIARKAKHPHDNTHDGWHGPQWARHKPYGVHSLLRRDRNRGENDQIMAVENGLREEIRRLWPEEDPTDTVNGWSTIRHPDEWVDRREAEAEERLLLPDEVLPDSEEVDLGYLRTGWPVPWDRRAA
ncbi:hypothetical protein HY734_00890 [Candidatus Uhrbacteria bacterium]|nr:hypothetical protein [Candidatus Uhrbacteria bacterium]